MRVTRLAGAHVDAQPLEIAARGGAQRFGKIRQHGRAAFEQDDLRGTGIEVAEVLRQRVARDLGERAGHLDAGRTAADDDERQLRGAARGIRLTLGALEREQHAAADLERVFERLQPGRVRPPVVVAEVRVRRAGGDDQVVVGESPRRRPGARRVRAGSMRFTSPSSTSTLRWRRRIHRIGDAMSPGDSAAIATW